MPEFLNQTYYGNTLGQWLISLALIVLSVIVGRVVYWVFRRWVRLLTRRTKTRLDDILIDMVEEPVVAALIVLGFRFALGRLTFSEGSRTTIAGVSTLPWR